MLKKTVLLTLFLSLLGHFGFSQLDKSGKKALKKARKHLYNQEFHEAKKYYTTVLEQESNDPQILFEYGMAYFKAQVKSEESIPFLRKALELSQDTISENLLILAQAYHKDNQFLNAKNFYKHFLRHYVANNKSGISYRNEVAHWIEMCENGDQFNVRKTNVEVNNLSDNVNSEHYEYAPVLDPKGNIIYFTSRREDGVGNKTHFDNLPYEDVYFATRGEDGNWSVAKNINKNKEIESDGINGKRHDATVNISADGNTLFVYKNGEIFKSEKNDKGEWEQPIRMNNNINFGIHNPSVFLTKDGEELYIVSVSEDKGFGGRDLYVATKSSSGEWNTPKNLGKTINTRYNEDVPYITDDGQTMYFSSQGHTSMGGYDVFKSKRQEDGSWGPPENMGIPINSGGDDIYFFEYKKENVAYYSSDRTGAEGYTDLYIAKFECKNIPVTRVRGLAQIQPFGYPAEGTVTVYDKTNGETVGTFEVNAQTGQYEMLLPPDQEYYLEFSLNNANLPRPYRENFTLPKQCEEFDLFQDIAIDHELDPNGQMIASEAHFSDAFFDVENVFLGEDHDKNNEKTSTSIQGQIQHGPDSKAEDVNIYLLNENNQILKVVKTDDEGKFAFNNTDTSEHYKIMIDNTELLTSQFGDDFENFKSEFKANGTIVSKVNNQETPLDKVMVFTSIDLKSSEQETKTDEKGFFSLDINTNDDEIAQILEGVPPGRYLQYENEEEVLSAYLKFYGEDDTLDIKRYIDRIEMDQSTPVYSDSLGEDFANLLFDFDKYFLREKSKNILNRLSAFMENHPNIEVTFSGHTDWFGTDEYNMVLSENRSKSAEKYTIDKGVNKDRITLEWHGESKPAVPNANPDGSDNPENRQLNRRVEIKLNIPQTAELILSL